MGLLRWLYAWFDRPCAPTAARVPQAGGAFGKSGTVFDHQGAVLLDNDISGLGGTLLWQVGAELAFNAQDGPQTVKLALYRDEHLLIESMPYEVTASRPALTISLGTCDKIGIGRYRYTLRAVVVHGTWARAVHRWMIWIEKEALMYYAIRGLWSGTGICTAVLGAVGEVNWEARLLVILSGLVTLLLSILLGGFVKHLAEHQEYNQSLQQRLNGQADRLFAVLEKLDLRLDAAQTKEQCELVQRFFSQQLGEVNHKLDALLGRQSKD